MHNGATLEPQNSVSFKKRSFLDCKTRWNSLLKMLQQFYKLQKEIKIAVVQLDRRFEFTNAELHKIKELCEALAPIEMAVEYLDKEDAGLLLAKKVVMFTLKKLRDQDTETGKIPLEKFEAGVEKRGNT